MARSGKVWRRRLHRALVVGGITLGILILLFLQFAVPYWIGALGLVVMGLLDVAIYLEIRHLRTLRRRAHTPFRKGDRVASTFVLNDKASLKDAYGVAIAFVVFVVGLCVEGVGLGADASSSGTGLVPLGIGILLATAGYATLMLYGWESGIGALGWGYSDLRTESEMYDTADDH